MPRTKSIELFQYAELDDVAQARARDWLRTAMQGDNFFSEHVTEEFQELLKALGFDVDSRRGLEWSGFGTQGSGAAFSGSWSAAACEPKEWLDDRPVHYMDNGILKESEYNKRWHDVAAPFIALSIHHPNASASVSASSRGFFMSGSDWDDGIDRDDETHTLAQWAAIDDEKRADGETFLEAARDLAAEFYRALESEYDYSMSDEQIAEQIEANEYEFTADGERA